MPSTDLSAEQTVKASHTSVDQSKLGIIFASGSVEFSHPGIHESIARVFHVGVGMIWGMRSLLIRHRIAIECTLK